MKKDISITMLVTRGEDWEEEVGVEGNVEYHTEIDYGSDADGNRGCRTIIIDDVSDIMAFDPDGGTVELNKQDLSLASDNLAQSFLEGSHG